MDFGALSGDQGLSIEVTLLHTWGQRARGLLGTKRGDASVPTVLLSPCSSIHTWGMKYDLNLAFLDKQGNVLCTKLSIKPCHMVWIRGTHQILERPSSEASWLETGWYLRGIDEQ